MTKTRKPRTQTNVEFVRDLMEFSKHGPLAQAFVLDALEKWSGIIAKTDPTKLDSPMLNGAAWVSVAREVQEKLAAHFAR